MTSFLRILVEQCVKICFLSFLTLSQAADFHSPRTDALGGAGHASPLLSDSLYLNPSFLSYNYTHALIFNYLLYDFKNPVDPVSNLSSKGKNFNISVVDGTKEALFQAGVGYTKREDARFLHLVASKSLLERLSIGMGTKVIFPQANRTRLLDTYLSASLLASSWFQASLIADNLFQSALSLGLNRQYTLGTKFNVMTIIFLYLDPHWISQPLPEFNQKNFGYQAGIEFPFMEQLFLRAGKFHNSTIPYQGQSGDGYGVGVGWLAPKLLLEYSLSQVTSGILGYSHTFGIGIYF
jgi:hypothetical protein